MLTFEDAKKIFAAEQLNIDIELIVDVQEETRYEGYCETCYYDYEVLAVTLTDGTVQDIADYMFGDLTEELFKIAQRYPEGINS